MAPPAHRALLAGLALLLAGLLVASVLAVIALTNTSWGREQVREVVLGRTGDVVRGELVLGRIDGNLLVRPTLRNVRIEDPEGRPFLEAESLSFRYSALGLLRRRVLITELEIVGARIVLDEPPGEDWNFSRIFAPEPDPDPDPDREPGWGSRVELQDIRLEDAAVTVRTTANGEGVARGALTDGVRERIARVPGGHQRVVEILGLDAGVARILLAHPDTPNALHLRDLELLLPTLRLRGGLALSFGEAGTRIVVEDLDVRGEEGALEGGVDVTLGESFRLHEAEVRFTDLETRLLGTLAPESEPAPDGRLSGRVEAGGEPIRLDAWLELTTDGDSRSRVALEGALTPATGSGEVRLHEMALRFEPLQAALLGAYVPNAQLRGVIEGRVVVDGPVSGPLEIDGALAHRDPVTGPSRVEVRGAVSTRDELRLVDMRVLLDPLRLAVLGEAFELAPTGSFVSGTVRMDGPPAGLFQIEGELALTDPRSGVSHVAGGGGIELGNGVRFRAFELEAAPLHLSAVRAFIGDLPLGGTVAGTGFLDGDAGGILAVRADLVHVDRGERTRIEGGGEMAAGEEAWSELDLTLHEVSLVTVGRFVPDAELQGSLAGRLHVGGSPGQLRLEADLSLPGQGALMTEGVFDLASEDPGYDFRLSLRDADLAALSRRAPEPTSLEGTIEASGRGTDPETMEVRLEGDLRDEEPGAPRTLHASVRAAGGVARVDSFEIGTSDARVRAEGSFGLVPTREGELSFELSIDSLHAVERFLPTAEGVTRPRPGVQRASRERREGELREAVRAAEVAYLATGEQPDLPAPGDTLGISGISRDLLAGRVEASGRVRGNLRRLRVEGGAGVEELLAAGHHVRTATVEYEVERDADGRLSARGEATGRSLLVAGFAYDSVSLRADYRERDGDPAVGVHAMIFQDEDTRILADAGFRIVDEGWEVRVDELAIAVDDARYRTPGPARVTWDGRRLVAHDLGLEVEGRAVVRTSGSLGREEPGELDLLIDGLEIGHLLHLLQDREGIRGSLRLDAPLRGTLEAPRFEAEIAVTGLQVDEHRVPDVRAGLVYAERELRVDGSVVEDGESRLIMDARLPLDLGLREPADGRLIPGPIRVQASLLDLPLESFSGLTHLVEDLEGRLAGRFSIGGTFDDPEVEGHLDLRAPSARIVPLGVRLIDVAGSFDLSGPTVTIDSLVAHAGGPIRMSGEVDLHRMDEPGFEIGFEARNAWFVNTEDIRMRADADLTISGPFEAVRVSGEVRTRGGVIRIPETRELTAPGPLDLQDPATFERVDRILIASRDALLDRSPLLENLQVDVRVVIDRDVWMRSMEANVEVFTSPEIGPLTVRMNGVRPDDLRLEGTLSTDRGDYKFMGRRFNIARGAATFTGETELDPLIRLTAEHEVQLPGREAFDIRIVLDGTASDLTTELESTAQPPLSQTDLLSLVVFGREAGSLLQQHGSTLSGQGGAGGPLVGNLAGRATQQFATVGLETLVNELEVEAARVLALDVLHIQPADAPAEIFTGRAGDVLRGTEIEAGRYVTPRLFVSGQARPSFVHPGARVEYRTDDGYLWRAVWRPRFLPAEPTLVWEPPERASVLGLFLFREWRY